MTRPASAPSTRSGWTRPCSPVTARSARPRWSTQIVDVRRGQLLDVVAGRDAAGPCAWLAARPEPWRAGIALGDAGPVGVLQVGVRHDAPRRRPGRRPVPRRASSPTRRSMSAGAGCRTRRSAIGAARPTRSTAAAAVSSWRANGSASTVTTGCSASSPPATRSGGVVRVEREGGRPPDLRPHRPPARRGLGRRDRAATSPTARCRSRSDEPVPPLGVRPLATTSPTTHRGADRSNIQQHVQHWTVPCRLRGRPVSPR